MWYLSLYLGLRYRKTRGRAWAWGVRRRSSAQGSGAGPLRGQKDETKHACHGWRSYALRYSPRRVCSALPASLGQAGQSCSGLLRGDSSAPCQGELPTPHGHFGKMEAFRGLTRVPPSYRVRQRNLVGAFGLRPRCVWIQVCAASGASGINQGWKWNHPTVLKLAFIAAVGCPWHHLSGERPR